MSWASDKIEQLRLQAAEAVRAGRAQEARWRLVELWESCPSLASAQFITARYREMGSELPLLPLRIDIERSFTVEPAVAVLRAKGYLHGFDLDVRVGGFDAVAAEMMDVSGTLYARQSDVVIVAVQTRSIAPDLWYEFSGMANQQVDAAIDRVCRQMHSWIQTLRSHSSAHAIVHTLDTPVFTSGGLLDASTRGGQREAIDRINARLREIAAAIPGVHLLDYDGLMARHGLLAWEDPVRWATLRMPLATDSVAHLADEWLRYLHPLSGRLAKVLVCDLDNTLWGGVLGEEGIEGIQVGGDYPGCAHQSLQRAILDLYHRGIVLAVSSKNDEVQVLAALANHPGMILRPEHFAALRINWNDKAASLREIAAELNVGTDALAFLDDNPHERQWVRSQLPEVWVIDLPDEPACYERVLRRQPVFERVALTDEDRRRGLLYAQQRCRRNLEQSCQTLEEYYQSLGLIVQVESVSADTLERAAQLIAKTNQFNLTGRRFTVQELADLQSQDDAMVLVTRVRDRFGDSGIVGVIVARLDSSGVCRIKALVMSCRVIGRTVETAMLAALCEHAVERGSRRLEGFYVPTARNEPARDFYPRHGFGPADSKSEECGGESSTGQQWTLDLTTQAVACPPWIEMIVPQEVGG